MSAIKISVRLWQMLYQIKAITCGSSFICSCASFSGCHGNRSQEIIKKTGEIIIIFIICVILKCGLSPINTSKDISMLIWLKYFGSEVQTCENEDNANAESIDNMALSESFYQMSIRSCKMWYSIVGVNCGGSLMCGYGSFNTPMGISMVIKGQLH